MKRKTFILPLALLLSFGLIACNGGNESSEAAKSEQPVASSKVTQPTLKITAAEGKSKLIKGETVQLSVADKDGNVVEGVAFESDAPTIASVNATGLVSGLEKGSATISASKDGYKAATIKITVDLPSIKVTAAANTVVIGSTVQLSADVEGVTWESSDATIATVNAGVVTGVKAGKVTISAKKDGYNAGSAAIEVTRPAATATLHWEQADHFSADGTWGTSYGSTIYGPGDTPVYERSSGNASDGTCIAYFGEGDKETLTFTSSAAVKAELTITMASSSAVADLSAVETMKFNDSALNLAGVGYEFDGSSNFYEISVGEVDIKAGENKLVIDFLGSAPYIDDLNIYAEGATTIAIVPAAEKDPVPVNETSITVVVGKTAQITSSITGLTYNSSSESIATVDANGLVTGVAEGTTTIVISKDGYKTVKLPVTVSEAEGLISVSINEGTSEGDVVTFRTSYNLTAPYNYIVDEFPADATLTLKVNSETAGTYNMFIKARASGGYSSTTSDDLATCMEVKVNGAAVAATGTVSGSTFTSYLLGEVNLVQGENTVTIKCLTAVPTINMLRFIPKA